jgi:hypothetical protein
VELEEISEFHRQDSSVASIDMIAPVGIVLMDMAYGFKDGGQVVEQKAERAR